MRVQTKVIDKGLQRRCKGLRQNWQQPKLCSTDSSTGSSQ